MREILHDIVERETRIQERVHAAVLCAAEAEPVRHHGPAKIHVRQQDAGVRGLRERPREVHGGRRLAVADPRARQRQDLEVGALPQRLHHVTEHAVLLGLVRRGVEQADEVLRGATGAIDREPGRRGRRFDHRRLDARWRARLHPGGW